ncbi:CAP domain-containing protein [Streptomyces sp. SCSIO 30461]|uniref:CAP domain-containing protein n=1 Tax=Streptomyces sp. SCSIO 30461 TaxID=3118085 RepID=UPI0030CD9FCB
MKTLATAMSVALSTAALWGATTVPAHTADGSSPTGSRVLLPPYYPNVDWITCEINKERLAKGLPALRISDRASQAGRSHAKDMATMKKLSSMGSDGRDLRSRMSQAGLYSNLISEFMAFGYTHDGHFADKATDPDPTNTVYRVLMNRSIVAIGIGYDRSYWDVNLLGAHRKLVTRVPVGCQARAVTMRALPMRALPEPAVSWRGPVFAQSPR